ncbi:MAG: WhiB family transcriptional regulator [Micromonosporaceae bacterium]
MSISATARARSTDWASRGACRDAEPDLFFPITSAGPGQVQIAEAKAVCARCAVRAQCLAYALETGQDCGVWGGTSEEERRAMRAQRRRHPGRRARHARVRRARRAGAGSPDL